MTTLQPIIEVQKLGTRFGRQIVHEDLDLTINRGEVLGIVGGSGCGKSVLMRYIIGLKKPQKGRIVYHTDPPYPSTQIGVLFQYGALISSLTVLENIMIPLKEIAKLPQAWAEEIARIKLSLVGLSQDTAEKFPSQLSGGMIKRAALARALALDPEILFLDEPTSGLDPISAAGFDQLILELQQYLKMTVVMITHDLESLIHICTRVAAIVDNKILVGTIEEVSALQHPWIQEYFWGIRGKRLLKAGDK